MTNESVWARILPQRATEDYRGARSALALFAPYVLIKFIMSANSLANPRSVLMGADAAPLDAYGAQGAQAVVLLFMLLAWSQLALMLVAAIVLMRYRALIPLTFIVLLIDHLGRRAVIALNPIERSEATPVGLYINLALAAVLLLGLALSLTTRRKA